MNFRDTIIDGLAFWGKVNVESSSMNELQKEFSKIGIDISKELLKELVKTPQEKIIDNAKSCGIQKITQYTYLFFDNSHFEFLLIKGGDINRFCHLMRLNLLSQSQKDGIADCINKNNGILHKEKILYMN